MIATLQNPKKAEFHHGEICTKTVIFHTVGYEQNEPQTFLKLLKANQVDVIVDVRQIPLSRKKGFSKNQLRELLATAGIEYHHLQTLGAPKEIRDRLRENGSWWEYVKGYQKVLESRQEDIRELIEFAEDRRICLLCFERKPEECHRSLVAKEMLKQGRNSQLELRHIRY